MKLTIFTPTYNRAYILPHLYQSLCNQTCKDFEWLVVDDGSTDDTESLIRSYVDEAYITVRYFRQTNSGKHIAINKGVELAHGELFFIVDSDDCLAADAVECLLKHYEKIADRDDIAGIVAIRTDLNGNRIGGELSWQQMDCSPLDFRMRLHIDGDMAEVVKTSVFRQYPFPRIPGERFCPEALVWNRISLRYKFRYVNEPIYRCEYRPDGLTAKILRIRMQSPEAVLMGHAELMRMPVPFRQKVKAAINFWRFSFCSRKAFAKKVGQGGALSLLMWPFGALYHLYDLHCLKK